MNLHSGVYIGRVRHRRREPRHEFWFPMFMVYLDLREIDRVFGGSLSRWWGTSRWSPARFRREDYLALHGKDADLDSSVRERVVERIGRRPTGPIRMLTHLRYFGYIFNPVTFYYCFDDAGGLDAIVAEITNTPWNERHSYVLDARAARSGGDPRGLMRWRFGKEFHVSPFFPMDVQYDWTMGVPQESLIVHMVLRDPQGTAAPKFDATLRMQRHDLTPALMRGLLLRYPLMTLRVILAIHMHALRLWLKRARIFPHPDRTSGRNVLSTVSSGGQGS